MSPRKYCEKLSVVAVLNGRADFEGLLALDPKLREVASSVDYVLIANGPSEATCQFLIKQIGDLPDATLHFLPEPLYPDLGKLIGIDNATGDWILCVADLQALPAMLTEMFEAIEPGTEHVTVRTQETRASASFAYRMLNNIYLSVYRKLTGLNIDRAGDSNRLYSRAAAQYILYSRQAEMLLHSGNLGNFFPGKMLLDPRPRGRDKARWTWSRLSRGWRVLVRSTTFPLRLVTLAAMLSCGFSALYAVAAVVIHAFQAGVTPGWTTLSLQISLMFFVVTLLLALISEYLVQIDRGVNRRLRYTITREIRSPRSRLAGRRNVWQISGEEQRGPESLPKISES